MQTNFIIIDTRPFIKNEYTQIFATGYYDFTKPRDHSRFGTLVDHNGVYIPDSYVLITKDTEIDFEVGDTILFAINSRFFEYRVTQDYSHKLFVEHINKEAERHARDFEILKSANSIVEKALLDMKMKRCNCSCHTSKDRVLHVMPCCDYTYEKY
jgi:hypothetical protein